MARENCVDLDQQRVETNQVKRASERESLASEKFFQWLSGILTVGFIVTSLLWVMGASLFWTGSIIGSFCYLLIAISAQDTCYEQAGKVVGWKRIAVAVGWPLFWLYDLFFSRY